MKRRPVNQSAMILFCSTIIATAPTPAALRPMPIPAGPAAAALTTGPSTITARPAPSTSRSPIPARQQPKRQRQEAAQQHERADQRSERRVVEPEQPHQVGAEGRDGLVLVAEADAGERHRRENQPGPGAHHVGSHTGEQSAHVMSLFSMFTKVGSA